MQLQSNPEEKKYNIKMHLIKQIWECCLDKPNSRRDHCGWGRGCCTYRLL